MLQRHHATVRALGGLLGLLAAAHAAAESGPPPRALVVVEGAGPVELAEVARVLESRGARLPHRIPPSILAGTVPWQAEEGLELPPGVRIAVERATGPRVAPTGLPALAPALRRFVARDSAVPSGRPVPVPLGGDVLEPEDAVGPFEAKHFSSAECDRPLATSAFLVGSVAVGIVLPESSDPPSSTEDWSNEDTGFPGQDRRDLVVAEIVEGCDALALQHPAASLSFVYAVHRDVPVPHEPINLSTSDRGLWIGAALESMGHGDRAETSGVSGWLHVLREDWDTDWALAAFVVDDWNDPDNAFPLTGPRLWFAYALLGGPYMVMTYDNDGWGIERMDVVFQHELGHVFHALDEYASAGNSCSMMAGYLATPNANDASNPADPACRSNVPCVMRGSATGDACEFTRGQEGLRDSDADGILDVRDGPPSSTLLASDPLLLESADVLLAGLVTGKASVGEGAHAPTTYFVNRVASAEASVDGGPWLPVAADDGTFLDRCERVSVPLTGLAEGWHDVRLRGGNDVGLVEPTPAQVRLYVNTDCLDDAAEPDDAAADAAPRPVGLHGGLHHCAYDQDWSRFHLVAGAAVTISLTYDESLADLSLVLFDPSLGELQRVDGTAGLAVLVDAATRSGTHYLLVTGGEGESDYTLSLDAECLDDAEEPDAPAPLGVLVGPGLYRSRVLCAADADGYRIGMQAGQDLSATIVFDETLGDADLELVDPAGAVVATSAGASGTEVVSAVPTDEGTYTIRVFGKTPLDRNVYDLLVGATGCIDDGAENDDDATAARWMSPGELDGALCAGDEDWVAFDLVRRSLVRIGLTHGPGGDVDLELRDAAGATVLARSARIGLPEDVTTETLAPGRYTLRIFGEGETPYHLGVQVADPILLFVRKDPQDALLTWNDAGQECYTLRRSESPGDWTGARAELVQEGDEAVADLSARDRGVVFDGRFLYCYLVDPHDCGVSFVGSTKTADVQPVYAAPPGTLWSFTYTITATNGGIAPATAVQVRDEIPFGVTAWDPVLDVLEVPPGATNASLAPPAGAFGNGQLLVTGFDVPAGESRQVRFRVRPNSNVSIEKGILDNQGHVEIPATPVTAGRSWPTDDPSTLAFPDDTRVAIAVGGRQLKVHALWHREVDIDLRVVDPCGNAIGEEDSASAECPAGTPGGQLSSLHSCAAPADRWERILWSGAPSAGSYGIELAYPADDACVGRGTEDVTVLVMEPSGAVWHRTVQLERGTSFTRVASFVQP